MHLIEQSGHGVPIVVKQYGKEAFELGKSFIIVTIPFEQPFTVANETENETVNETVKLSNVQEKMLILIKQDANISIKDLCTKLSVSRATVTRNLSPLKELKKIKRLGYDKGGTWVVIDK